ncbi:MAG: helix-turn-helix domain-containing protein [Verrucomicrobia bacterium]|nr:helix-turn-helix domain-containing protein [Verrucomicrobiota bacterium]
MTSEGIPNDLVFTQNEACALLKVSRPTLRNMIRRGAIRRVRPTPRTIRIPRSSIIEWVEGGGKK